MKISKKSWHYRVIEFTDFSHPDNLCAYFWKTVWVLLFIPGAALCILGFIGFASIPLWWWLTNETMGVSIVIGTIEIIALLLILYHTIKERREWEVVEGKREHPQQTLFGAWAHAQHRKICPLIKFE